MNLKLNIPLKMYECTFYFRVAEDITKEVNKLKKRYKQPLYEGNLAGYADEYEFNKYYIFISADSLNVNTICHEMFHNVNTILDDRGISDEESKSWLMGYLSQKVFDFLKKSGVEL